MKINCSPFDRLWLLMENPQPFEPVEIEVEVSEEVFSKYMDAQKTFFEMQDYINQVWQEQTRKAITGQR